jgi:hypothetical protein
LLSRNRHFHEKLVGTERVNLGSLREDHTIPAALAWSFGADQDLINTTV